MPFNVKQTLLFKEQFNHFARVDSKVASKINRLISAIEQDPFRGIGKPEKLKNSPFWSRRVTDKDRLVYSIKGDVIRLVSCRGHYGDH